MSLQKSKDFFQPWLIRILLKYAELAFYFDNLHAICFDNALPSFPAEMPKGNILYIIHLKIVAPMLLCGLGIGLISNAAEIFFKNENRRFKLKKLDCQI
jgi:hypothetical protein